VLGNGLISQLSVTRYVSDMLDFDGRSNADAAKDRSR
jgi:hypothetical protein